MTLSAALARRALLNTPRTNAYRLLNRAGDGFPALAVDRYNDVLIAHLYNNTQPPRPLLTQLAAQTGARAVYLKHRPNEASKLSAVQRAQLAPTAPFIGEAVESTVIRENDMLFLIRPADGLSVGLFLDMREQRAWVRAHSTGQTVLNCFAYTCGFGLAALAGGAVRAVNVDVSRKYLDWGMENARLNGCAPDVKDFIAGDVFDWLQRFARRKQTFDTVIVDPPPYSTTKANRFSITQDYAALLTLAAQVTAPGGTLLACANAAELALTTFKAAARDTGGELIRIEHEPEPDFPTRRPYLKIGFIQMGQLDKVTA